MFLNKVNDLKIYNLSAGKAIPDWLTDRRKQKRLINSVDSRRQIELIQDFNMPAVATSIRMTPDNQYILATGTYKPRLKCYELSNLSLKFERCFDSEAITFEVINNDYSKIALLQCDRYIEMHSASGRLYRLRIPHFGRDIRYHKPSCDLFIVGTTSEIYRLNIERGQFLPPFKTNANCLNSCDVNANHGLLMVGASNGTVESWDPRIKDCCSTLDVANKLSECKEFPSISTIKFKSELQMGVGTSTGHILLYDIRSKEPILVKNHRNGLPIKRLFFNKEHQSVYSLDESMLKIWEEQTGRQTAYIESAAKLNDFCTITGTGMIFLAQEDVKMLSFYIPAMGPAPSWCSFLDNLTEEIESESLENIYDDYQFVTYNELKDLGLDNLIGTNLLKGYMHGYFMDVRLYNKAKTVIEPFVFNNFQKDQVRKNIERERDSRLKMYSNLPKVNYEFAVKLTEQMNINDKGKTMPNLIDDCRFKALFENADFAINKNAEEYKLLAPVINRMEKTKKKKNDRIEIAHVVELHSAEKLTLESDNDDGIFGLRNNKPSSSENDDSTDDENMKEYAKEMKAAYKDNKVEQNIEIYSNDTSLSHPSQNRPNKHNTILTKSCTQSNYKMIPLESDNILNAQSISTIKASLEERVHKYDESNINVIEEMNKSRQMNFTIQSKSLKNNKNEIKNHLKNKRKFVRSVSSLKLKNVNFK